MRRSDFVELPSGAVRLAANVGSELVASWIPPLARAIAPTVEHVARMVAGEAGIGRMPTPLTQDARAEGRVGIRKRDRRAPARLPQAPRLCAR
jgi:hypothetical protein